MSKPIILVREGRELRPTLRINPESGYCGGAQWIRAFAIGIHGKVQGDTLFAGSHCVAAVPIAVEIRLYFNFLKASGWKLKEVTACRCPRAGGDSWRCAREQQLNGQIACICECHRKGKP